MEEARIETQEQIIRETHSIWIDAVNKGDLARLLELMTDDIVFISPGQEPFGRDGFRANFSSAHQQLHIRCTSELEEVVAVGDVAYTRSRDAVSLSPRAGGRATQFAGYRVSVYRRAPEGGWRLARDIHTVSAVES